METYSKITPENLELLESWLKENTDESNAQIRLACRNRFLYFVAFFFPEYVTSAFAGFHYLIEKDLHDLTDGVIDEYAIIAARETGKTTLAAKLYLIWLIANDLSPYNIYDGLNLGNSASALFDIAFQLSSNARLQQVYGELYSMERKKGEMTKKRQMDFIIPPVLNENNELIRNGARVEAKSTAMSARGFVYGAERPSLLILDDFESLSSVKSEADTAQVRAHLQEISGGMSTKMSRKVYVANYLSDFCNVHSLIERSGDVRVFTENHPLKRYEGSEGDKKLRVRIIPLCDGILPVNLKQGDDAMKYLSNPAWPERYSIYDKDKTPTQASSVEAWRRKLWDPSLGDAPFLMEMMLQPIDESLAVFKKEYIQHITWEELRKKQTLVYVAFDTPSRKEGAINVKGDYCGISIVWTDRENKVYVKAWHELLGPTQIVDKMISVYTWLVEQGMPPMRLAWEDTAFTRGLEPLFNEEKRKRNLFITLEWLTTKGRSKEDRIRSNLLARYEQRNVFHLEGECKDLENELLRFPHSKNDDTLDATAYAVEMIRPWSGERHEAAAERHTPKTRELNYWELSTSENQHNDNSVYSLIGM